MGDVTVMFTLPSDAFDALQATAKREGAAPATILRAALRRDLKTRRVEVENPKRDPAYIAALRTLLARDIVEAMDWEDLKGRLASRGYELKMSKGRLMLYGWDSGDCLVDATEIGASYGALMRRFGDPLPKNKAAS